MSKTQRMYRMRTTSAFSSPSWALPTSLGIRKLLEDMHARRCRKVVRRDVRSYCICTSKAKVSANSYELRRESLTQTSDVRRLASQLAGCLACLARQSRAGESFRHRHDPSCSHMRTCPACQRGYLQCTFGLTSTLAGCQSRKEPLVRL